MHDLGTRHLHRVQQSLPPLGPGRRREDGLVCWAHGGLPSTHVGPSARPSMAQRMSLNPARSEGRARRRILLALDLPERPSAVAPWKNVGVTDGRLVLAEKEPAHHLCDLLAAPRTFHAVADGRLRSDRGGRTDRSRSSVLPRSSRVASTRTWLVLPDRFSAPTRRPGSSIPRPARIQALGAHLGRRSSPARAIRDRGR